MKLGECFGLTILRSFGSDSLLFLLFFLTLLFFSFPLLLLLPLSLPDLGLLLFLLRLGSFFLDIFDDRVCSFSERSRFLQYFRRTVEIVLRSTDFEIDSNELESSFWYEDSPKVEIGSEGRDVRAREDRVVVGEDCTKSRMNTFESSRAVAEEEYSNVSDLKGEYEQRMLI